MLTAHIVTSVGWLGIALVVAFLAIAASTTGDPLLTRALYRTLEITPWLSVPMGIVAFGIGVFLSLGTTWGLVRHWWVVAKIGIAARSRTASSWRSRPCSRCSSHGPAPRGESTCWIAAAAACDQEKHRPLRWPFYF